MTVRVALPLTRGLDRRRAALPCAPSQSPTQAASSPSTRGRSPSRLFPRSPCSRLCKDCGGSGNTHPAAFQNDDPHRCGHPHRREILKAATCTTASTTTPTPRGVLCKQYLQRNGRSGLNEDLQERPRGGEHPHKRGHQGPAGHPVTLRAEVAVARAEGEQQRRGPQIQDLWREFLHCSYMHRAQAELRRDNGSQVWSSSGALSYREHKPATWKELGASFLLRTLR